MRAIISGAMALTRWAVSGSSRQASNPLTAAQFTTCEAPEESRTRFKALKSFKSQKPRPHFTTSRPCSSRYAARRLPTRPSAPNTNVLYMTQSLDVSPSKIQ